MAAEEGKGLVLSRNAGERIKIGDDIVLTVWPESEHSAKVAIQAPREIRITREAAIVDAPRQDAPSKQEATRC